jgi:hypothetical protein
LLHASLQQRPHDLSSCGGRAGASAAVEDGQKHPLRILDAHNVARRILEAAGVAGVGTPADHQALTPMGREGGPHQHTRVTARATIAVWGRHKHASQGGPRATQLRVVCLLHTMTRRSRCKRSCAWQYACMALLGAAWGQSLMVRPIRHRKHSSDHHAPAWCHPALTRSL